jgi:LytS/YehU family sensor histidine kinase
MTRIKEEKLHIELNSLKAQINPHFLFNTLNSIYALAVKNDEKTADAVINLSELMRYIIKDAHNNKVPLEKELNYISNYIDLQRSRLGNTARIYFTADGDARQKEIAPLLLITFIENAFKYGINPDEDSEIRIQLDIKNTDLHLQVYNKKVKTGNAINSTCIGIKNTKERLQLLYPSKHTISITDNNSYFLVNLTITLS